MTYEDIAFVVCSEFQRHKVVAVLVGGGAATYYAPEAYETRDLDFVLHFELFGMPKATILGDLGFIPSNSAGTYEHAEIPFTLEILQGPLAIGQEVLTTYATLNKGDRLLRVIAATDCVKDRLAHAIHFHDLNAARQAAEVAKVQAVDLEAIRIWAENEGGSRAFSIFERFLIA